MFNLYAGAEDPGYLVYVNVYLACQSNFMRGAVGAKTHANDYVNHSLSKAREILHRYKIGCRVVSSGIHPVEVNGRLVIAADPLPIGEGDKPVPQRDDEEKPKDVSVAKAARKQIDDDRAKAGKPDKLTDAVVVIFGNSDQRLAGCAVATGESPKAQYPFCFATVNLMDLMFVSETTMLHEILHCAGAMHAMAQPFKNNPYYEDPYDIMVVPSWELDARVRKLQLDMRKNIGFASLAKLKQAYFFDRGFTPQQGPL